MTHPCVLDDKNWCVRHRQWHPGKLREIALDPSAEGMRYRRHWDEVYGVHDGSPPSRPCRHLHRRARDAEGLFWACCRPPSKHRESGLT